MLIYTTRNNTFAVHKIESPGEGSVCLSTQQSFSEKEEAALPTFEEDPGATVGFSYQFIAMTAF